MKNLLKMRKSIKYFIAALTLLITLPASADKKENLDDMSFAEIVNSVNLGKQAELIQKFQDKEAKNVLLKNKSFSAQNGCSVDAIRNHEIIVVTIPASKLFGSNATELLEQADSYLEPFKRYLKEPDMYRVVAVMHTDNTGSELYREELTIARAEAVAGWFEDAGVSTDYLFPYAMSDDIPLVPNDSFENREKNRRLEIYLVPGETMLNKAKQGRIAM